MFARLQHFAGKLTFRHLVMAIMVNIFVIGALSYVPIADALPPFRRLALS